ncbi:MAG TPA: hypothetical protein VGA61_12625, partial [Anaerolineae bacterium]
GEESLWQRVRSTPLVLPALLLVVAYLISTALSVVPGISFFGSYVRLQGTFTFLCYVAIFAMVLTHLRTRSQFNRLIYTIIVTSVPISLYGLLQHAGVDPLPWGGDVQQRVAANMGNAIFVAAYLIMAFFLTLERLIDSIAGVLREDHNVDMVRVPVYILILGLQAVTIIFTQSRGPWLGWGAGLYVFGILGLRLLGRWSEARRQAGAWLQRSLRTLYLALVSLTVISIGFLVVMNLPHTPLAGLRKVPYVGRMSTLLNCSEGTNAVRCLIWEGVVDLMLKPHDPIQFPAGTPAPWWAGGAATIGGKAPVADFLNPVRWLIGYGPESLWVAFNRFYPPDLAHYEARNASPDRSHNETFDALVRTGALGLAAQLALFVSLFYFALRWLGLIGSRARRNLFLTLLAAGALLGIFLPWFVEHQWRLAGIGLPAGMIIGLIIYVTLDLLLPAPVASGEGAGVTGSAVVAVPAGRQQVLILALFASLVAHFAEVHFGIAIVSTLTHFWVLSAALVVTGMGWLRDDTAPAAVAATLEPEPVDALRTQPAVERVVVAAAQRPAKGKRGEPARGRGSNGRAGGPPAARERRAERPLPIRVGPVASWRLVLPYALVGCAITLVIVWDYVINQSGLHGAFNVLWTSFTTRTDASRAVVSSGWLLVLPLLTWLIAGALALAETARGRDVRQGAFAWGKGIALYAGLVLGVFLIYGLLQSGETDIVNFSGLAVFDHIAGYVALFDGGLLALGLALAVALAGTSSRPAAARWFGNPPLLSLTVGVVAAVLAVAVIININVKNVQADIYYKQGLAYEEAGQWEGAIILYNEAAQQEQKEDYYYLFLGRALLEFSGQAQPGTATLPADFSKVTTGDLLRVAQSAYATRTRDDLMRAAYAVLIGAQRLNPLNTDHTANVARLFRSWAFSRTTLPDQVSSNTVLRQQVAQHPDQVDLPRLKQSLDAYRQAIALSPRNAQLWNEEASVRFISGDTQGALTDVATSLQLDQRFFDTYVLEGDMKGDAGDKRGALDAYLKASALRPGDMQVLQATAVYSAQVGDVPGALALFKRITDNQTAALKPVQDQLAKLDAQATQSGGYNYLGVAAEQRRQQLQNAIDAYRNQLQSAYRNQALVLRDAGRLDEAEAAAQAALANATADQQSALQQLIADLKKR